MRLANYITEKFEWYRIKGKPTIKEIAERYYDEGDKAHDSGQTKTGRPYTIIASVKELDKYKEYDWNKKHFRKRDIEPEYWNKLVKSIKKEGIKEPIYLILYKNERRGRIGEGNHRLGVAKEIGLKEVPVIFEYYMGKKPKPPEKPDKGFEKMLSDLEKEQEEIHINKLLKQLLGEI